MTKIGIIGAMASEVASLKDLMEMNVIIKKAGMNFYDGILYGKSVVVVQCGYGKVNAGICAQILVDLFEVTHIINTGVAGSLNKRPVQRRRLPSPHSLHEKQRKAGLLLPGLR